MNIVMKGRYMPRVLCGSGGVTTYAVATLVPAISNTVCDMSSSFTLLVQPFFTYTIAFKFGQYIPSSYISNVLTFNCPFRSAMDSIPHIMLKRNNIS